MLVASASRASAAMVRSMGWCAGVLSHISDDRAGFSDCYTLAYLMAAGDPRP